MATTAVHGRLCSVKIGTSGAPSTPTDISTQVLTSSLNNEAGEIDVTAYQASAREYIADFPGATFQLEGNAAATVMTHMYGIYQNQAQAYAVEYGPEGTASTKRKLTFNAVPTALNESEQSTGQQNKFTLTMRVSGAVTVGAFS